MNAHVPTGGSVAELMSPVVATVTRDARFKDLARLFTEHALDALPVVDDAGRVLGIITASDLLVRLAGVRIAPWDNRLAQWAAVHRKVHAGTAGGLMSTPPITVTPDASAVEAGRLAARARLHVLPVVDESRSLVGMLTRRDLVRLYLREDSDVRAGVVAALGGSAERVDVQVADGVVTLRGTVADALAARALVDRARFVPGVVDVRSHVTYPQDLAG